MFKDKIIKALSEAAGLGSSKIHLETPEREEHGDYSSNIAMAIFSKFQNPNSKIQNNLKSQISNLRSPHQLAEKIADKLRDVKDLEGIVEKIEIAGPGFINFWLSEKALLSDLREVLEEGGEYGSSNLGKNKTVVIDYSSPNIAKRFGIGHLRSTIIGQALYNLHSFLGYKTIGDNHLGDWGTQFGMILAQIDRENKDAEKLTIGDLEKLYIEFNKDMEDNPELRDTAQKWFKKLEEGDKKAKQIWEKIVEISKKEFDRIYKLLGVEIDYAQGESFYEDKMESVLEELREKGLTKKSQGAEIVELSDMPPAMVLKSDGATTYLTRDLAAIKYRVEEWDPEKIIYEVGSEQSLHFRQLFKVAEKLSWTKDRKLVHVAHGLIRFKEGKMSTRKGQTIKLEEVLNEAIDRAKKIIEKSETSRGLDKGEIEDVAKKVGIGAVKYFDLMHHPRTDIIFDWEKMFVLEGNSAPYLQYTCARTQSVLDKAKGKGQEIKEGADLNREELAVLRELVHFPEVIENAAENYSPNLLCNYLFQLAQKYNGFYNRHRIIDPEVKGKQSLAFQAKRQEVKDFRIALTAATGQVLKNGLGLLGIEAPERM